MQERPYMPAPDEYLAHLEKGQPTAPATKPPRNYRRLIKRIIVAILLLIFVVALGVGWYIFKNVQSISKNPMDFSGLTADSSGRTNILFLGIGDPGHAGEKLSDTMMVMSLNAHTHQAALISIPRDLRVKIDGYGYSKINAANAYGGVSLAEQTVSETLGIPIQYYVQTDFSGLKQLVDAVGGLDVNVKDRLVDTEYPCDDNQYKVCGLDIKPGLQHMDGTTALKYARCRKGTCGNDFGRAARQQEILGLLRLKIVTWGTLTNPAKLALITRALRDNLVTDLGAVQMIQAGLVWQEAQKHQPINFVLSTAPGGYLRDDPYGSSDLLPIGGDFSQIQNQVQTIFTNPPPPVPTQ